MTGKPLTAITSPMVHISKRGVMTEKKFVAGVRQTIITRFENKTAATSYARGCGYRTTKKKAIFNAQA